MGKGTQIRQGDIYWLDDCPPLEGDVAKRRPVIVLSPPTRLQSAALVLVVATSTSVLSSEQDRIALPNRRDEPQTKSGLPRPCWAVPRWFLLVGPERLTDYVGYLRAPLLRRIADAVDKRMRQSD